MNYKFTTQDVINAKTGDNKALMKVIDGMAPKIGAAVAKVRSSSASVDDLRQAGVIGVINAVHGFDPDRGVQFPAYAGKFIHAEVSKEVSASISGPSVPHDLLKRMVKLEANGDPDLDDKMAAAGYKDSLFAQMALHNTSSLDQMMSPDDDNDWCWEPSYGDFQGVDNENLAMKEALAALPDRERFVITMTYGMDGGEPLADLPIGEMLGIHRSGVSKLRKSAMAKLKEALS